MQVQKDFLFSCLNEQRNISFQEMREAEDSTRVKCYLLEAYADLWSEMGRLYGEAPPTK